MIKNLAKIRKEFAKTQKDMAEILNISKPTYNHYESGRYEPSLETMIKLADYFNCSVDYLLGHQAKNVLYLDSFTEDQKELIRLVQTLDERKVLKVIGYIERLNDTPIEEVLQRMNKREEE